MEQFPLAKKITYLDNAAGTLKPLCVIEAMSDFYINYPINPHSIDSRLGVKVLQLVNQTREEVAKILNAKKQEIIFTSGTTDSLNKFALMIEDQINVGDEILLSPFNHSSNILPFLRLAKLKKAKIKYTTSFIDEINPKTKLIALAQVNNTFNVELNLASIYNQAKKFGALVINDAAQAITQEKVSLDYADVVVFSGNKIYGPTGIGILAIKEKLLKILQPIFVGGGSVVEIGSENWLNKEGVSAFEAGSPNTAGIIGLGKAIEFFNNLGQENFNHLHELATYAFDKLKKVDGAIIHSKRGDLIILFNIANYSAQDVVSYLGHQDIILRAGSHCAKRTKFANQIESTIRMSFACYNSQENIDKCVEWLKKGQKGDYLEFL